MSNPQSPDSLDRLNLFLARYHVGLGGACQKMAYKGEPFGLGKLFCHACFVLEIGDDWYLATAGHLLDDLDQRTRNGDIIEGLRLVHYLAPGAVSVDPIRFDLETTRNRHIVTVVEGIPCEDSSADLDIGLAAISRPIREALELNGIKPAPIDESCDLGGYSGFVVFGLPIDLFGPMESDDDRVWREVNPTIASFNLLPGQGQRQRDDLLVGTFPAEMDIDANGLSGGLIFGFHFDRDRNKDRFAAVAVQSHWCPQKKRAYGCPIATFVERAKEGLA